MPSRREIDKMKRLPDAQKVSRIWNAARKTDKKKWNAKMYRDRWKNLGWVTVMIVGLSGALWLGQSFKEGFFSPIHYYIAMGVGTIILAIAAITWFSYVWIIVKGKK
jgi:hypothetical protein